MNVATFAENLLFADTLAGKMAPPAKGWQALDDERRGAPRFYEGPGRPANLEIATREERLKFPHPSNFGDPQMAIRALHAFANHELMALELMAWALLAFPEAPAAFRAGLIRLIADEQRHLRYYVDRIAAKGAEFGDLPVNDHFWRCAPALTSPLKWVCAMNLTFEQANLDHAPFFARSFRRVDDEDTAQVLDQIFADEIHHVGFGAQWLREYGDPDQNSFEIYVANLSFHNIPARGRGDRFDVQARREAGLDEAFIQGMAASS